MSFISDLILQQMATAGKPRVTTEVTKATPAEEPLDIGSIGLLLYMLLQGMGKGKTAGASEGEIRGAMDLSPAPGPGLLPPIPATPTVGATNYGKLDPMMLMNLILKATGGGR